MILCAGEALIDMLPRETPAGEPAFTPAAGGAVFNTAIALGRLGGAVGLFSGVSEDLFGTQLAEALTASKVNTSYLHRSDRPTTLAFVTLKNGQASYAFYDENTAGRMLSRGDLPQIGEEVTAAFFGGISLAVEPCASAYATLMRRASKGRVTMIDPNIRPSFIGDEARYRDRINSLLKVADIVKLSDEDAHWLRGDADLQDIAAQLLDQGAKLVCMTEGAKGVTAYTRHQTHVVLAEKAKVVDTVGAGDTFNAGLLAGLARADVLTKRRLTSIAPETLVEALRLGVRAAAVTVSRAGANPPWAADLAL